MMPCTDSTTIRRTNTFGNPVVALDFKVFRVCFVLGTLIFEIGMRFCVLRLLEPMSIYFNDILLLHQQYQRRLLLRFGFSVCPSTQQQKLLKIIK